VAVIKMAQTKKLLVAFDPQQSKSPSSDFLVPVQAEERTILYGLKSECEHMYGLMIYLGQAITENDLFAKLVDSGTKIANVDETVSRLRQYIEKLQSLRIGNVVRLHPDETGIGGFELELVANTPAGMPH